MMFLNWLRSSKTLKTACLSAGLVTAWGASNDARAIVIVEPTQHEVSGSVTPTYDLTNVYMIYGVNSSGYSNFRMEKIADSISANSPYSFSFLSTGYDYDYQNYTLLALYGTNAVTVGVNPWTEPPFGLSWDDYFGETPYTEDVVAGSLVAGDSGLIDFVQWAGSWKLCAGFGETLPLVNFSQGSDGGTAVASVREVPEPTTLSLLVISGLAVAFECCRRKVKDGSEKTSG
jgi:hypothetical protein